MPPGLWQRIQTLWRLKLAITVGLSLWFWSFYLVLSRHALVPISALPLTWLDQWAGFNPHPWAWVYESNFLITGMVPWLIVSRETMRRFVVGFVLLTSANFIVFALFPVASPRPANLEEHAALIFITRVDGPLNAFPSLHAGTLFYTLALARRMFDIRRNPIATALLLVWSALILYSTLATKQHYALDLLAGALVGCTADWLAWRHSAGEDSASASTRRKVGAESQAG